MPSPTRNERLAAAICEAGLSYAAVAAHLRAVAAENGAQVRTNSAAVSHWVRGVRPRPDTAAYLAEALSRRARRLITPTEIGLGSPETAPHTSGDAVADLTNLGRMDVDRRGFLTSAFSLSAAAAVPASTALPERTHTGGTIGRAEVETVRDVVVTFMRADERLGGGVGRSAIAEYLTSDATAYLRGPYATGRVRADMLGAVAQLATLAAWKAHDVNRDGLAQRYYTHAWQLADASGSRGHASWILRLMAHQAIDLGHGEHCTAVAESAVATGAGHVDQATEGQLYLALARTRASRGDARAARAALHQAEQRISPRAADAERPPWAQQSGDPDALLASHTAKTLRSLDDSAAEDHMNESVQRWNAQTHPRIRALNLCGLGNLRARKGRLESACDAWGQALPLLEGVDSARARSAVDGIRQALSPYRRRGIAEAADIDTRAARWQYVTGVGKL